MTSKIKARPVVMKDLREIARQSYSSIYKFFKNCIDQNIILNFTRLDHEYHQQFNVKYFATTVENAQTFQQAFLDTSAEFSMKKMYGQYGFDISLDQQEINFDLVDHVIDLIGQDGKIWGKYVDNNLSVVDNK